MASCADHLDNLQTYSTLQFCKIIYKHPCNVFTLVHWDGRASLGRLFATEVSVCRQQNAPPHGMPYGTGSSLDAVNYWIIWSMSKVSLHIKSVDGLLKHFYQGLWLVLLSTVLIGPSKNRFGLPRISFMAKCYWLIISSISAWFLHVIPHLVAPPWIHNVPDVSVQVVVMLRLPHTKILWIETLIKCIQPS